MGLEDLKVIISDEISRKMSERGIKENEIKEVISYTLNGGIHLNTSDKSQFLAKKRLDNFTVYVEYVIENDAYKVVNAYSHRVGLTENQKEE